MWSRRVLRLYSRKTVPKKIFIVTEKAIWGKKWKDAITTIKQKEMFSRGIKVGDPEQVRRAHPTRLSSWQRGVIAYINGTIASLLVLISESSDEYQPFYCKGINMFVQERWLWLQWKNWRWAWWCLTWPHKYGKFFSIKTKWLYHCRLSVQFLAFKHHQLQNQII